MLRTPSGRRNHRNRGEKLNLIPILDSVFIFIFFLLMSASFLNLFEISSAVPILSSTPPPPNKRPPLALTVIIEENEISVATGVPSTIRHNFGKGPDGKVRSSITQGIFNLPQKRPQEGKHRHTGT